MNKKIIYGGAFNPPTKGHYKIIEYLVNKFPNNKIIVLPTNNFYKSNDIVSFEHRKEMIKLMCKDIINNIEISDYEQTLSDYLGTYYTLEHFNHPYFVMGADSLETLHKWINYPKVMTDNNFIVFPRGNININEIFNNDELLKKYRNNFYICDDFMENNISSSGFRKEGINDYLDDEVYNYILKHKLYNK